MSYIQKGKPRKEVAPGNCMTCGASYMRTESEIRRGCKLCPPCNKVKKELALKNPHRVKRTRTSGRRPLYEVLLPKTLTPWFCKTRKDWYMRVRLRRKNTKEPFQSDRVYLGIGENVTDEQVRTAFDAAYARQQMEGRSRHPIEKHRKWAKKKKVILHRKRSFREGTDRNMGVVPVTIRRKRYKVMLPDPLTISGTVRLPGYFKNTEEARIARNDLYKELRKKVLPCEACGMLPVITNGRLMHITASCPNQIQLPPEPRPLFQVKMWNHIFRTGQQEPGVYSGETLRQMGFLKRPKYSQRYFARVDVEWNLDLHTQHIVEPKPAKDIEEDEEIGFE